MADTSKTPDPIHKSLLVPWMPQEAFHMFASRIGEWWPLDVHSRAKSAEGERAVDAIVEPHEGGRCYEVLQSGEHKEWGKVLVYKPGQDLVLEWSMGNPAASQLEIIFSPAGSYTKVDLFHRNFENMGERGQEIRDKHDLGWDSVFIEKFGSFARSQEAA